MTQDEDQLKLLSIFHYVLGGIHALFSLFPLIYLAFGLFMLNSPQHFGGTGGGAPPPAIAWFMITLGVIGTTIGLTFAILQLYTGRFLAERSHYTFCFVIACIECISMPFGTALGIFTIITLSRESVKQSFAG